MRTVSSSVGTIFDRISRVSADSGKQEEEGEDGAAVALGIDDDDGGNS